MSGPFRRLVGAIATLLGFLLVGGVGYWLLGRGLWTYWEGVYMTAITVTTVGFGELPGMNEVPGARALTVLVAAFGVGAVAYAQSNVTVLVFEGAFGDVYRKRRMMKAIERLNGHVVVAGAGATGRHVIEELFLTRTPFVVIEKNEAHVKRISEELCAGEMLYVLGDATDDHALLRAGVKRARGVVAALTDDRDNVFVTLSARSLNPTARIVSKVVEDPTEAKMLKAGASSVVSPTQIGGRRIASELLRPRVNEFFDKMFRDNRGLRLEELSVEPGSTCVGKALSDTLVRRESGLLVIDVGDTLIVMGQVDAIAAMRNVVAA